MLFTNKKTAIAHSKAAALIKESQQSPAELLATLATRPTGLTTAEAEQRLEQYGPNQVITHEKNSKLKLLGQAFLDPFVIVLIFLAILSALTADYDGAIVMTMMILLSVVLRFVQELRSEKASAALQKMIENTCAITRQDLTKELPMTVVVPGDIIELRTGDLIPADAYLLKTKDLFLNQSSITGEAMPVEKFATLADEAATAVDSASENQVFDQHNLVFMGTDVLSGSGQAVILRTGSQTLFGDLAKLATQKRGATQFDRGLRRISRLLITMMIVLVPIVFLINAFTKGDWTQAFFFAVAVAVGLTPEMLPMVVNSNLAKGATTLAKKKVIVKELRAVQNLGAVDVLCTDKTGTLTQDQITLMSHLDPQGNSDARVLQYAFMNSYYQTGWRNLLDQAVIDYGQAIQHATLMTDLPDNLQKVDEIPFDFNRRRLTVVVKNQQHQWMVTKGAFEEILKICDRVEWNGRVQPMTATIRDQLVALNQRLNNEGMRILGIAYRMDVHQQATYQINDEQKMVFAGLMGFLDPEKATAKQAIQLLQAHGVTVKILTGDNGAITQHVAGKVGIKETSYLEGQALAELNDQELAAVVEEHDLFVKLNPVQKARIIKILQQKHTVAFMGDGINDAPALRQADVGISVENAADVTKEASQVILLEKSLLVLEDGIIEGRVVYRNTMKYIRMTIASNFGNALSVLLASIVLPFLPMLSLQILVQNLIYDLAQMSLPWDHVDDDSLRAPTPWRTKGLLKFALIFGPVSSIFDLITFAFMWFALQANTVAQAGLFQTGWFLVGLITQSLIIFVYRTTQVPFFKSRAGKPVIVATVAAILVGFLVVFGPLQHTFGFVGLPAQYWLFLPLVVLAYLVLSDFLKARLNVGLD
ncbi:magnesium-translocating P-type ATPase [Lapidilactobacillus luobeiensis]|uniref:magnesium-translocating P-type ATPase n=1 Tax=Lapidilactobacillus luobeiensis TaxID=2950371 RepID=UPI0021C26D76|nr:magnesium-translocating P-type ATPase [Lapidilactobacillus luobeiensis]